MNFLFRVPIAGTTQGKLWQPGELDRPEVRTVSPQEIVTGKMLAMLDRSAARDVWDLANLQISANEVIELPSFRTWFIALAAILNHPLPTYTLSRLKDRVTEHAVLEQLAPMLTVDTKPLADDLVKQAWGVLSEFMTLRPNEAAYVASIEQGELRPELLFPDDPKTAHRIAEHPAIQWKVKNVRSHLAQRAKTHTKK